MSVAGFHPVTQAWFDSAFDAPTRVQGLGWPVIAERKHALLLAPTGSGKTLAAFLAGLDRLVQHPAEAPGVRILYVSPLKALVYDIERNLRSPLVGMGLAAARQGVALPPMRVDVRTGDTSQRDRARQKKNPGEILVTTPESLYLLLGSQARETLKTVETVIIDEIHVLAGSKRGAHLALSLERLSAACEVEPQRIGLSATQRPLEVVAGFLGGDRPVEIVDTSEPPHVDLRIVVTTQDMERPTQPVVEEDAYAASDAGSSPEAGHLKRSPGIWPTILPEILALIRQHTSTIVFTNSRLLCERLAQRLNEMAGEELVRAHHGSISHAQRTEIEEALKAGDLPALVATSSLELGIDMGAVDLVVLVESPGSVARGLQRIGRAGHAVGERSVGRIFPKFRGDLVEAAVVTRHMNEGRVEETRIPQNCLDVLAQQIIAMVCVETLPPETILQRVRRAAPYRNLGHASFISVVEMLSGRYPSEAFSELRPRIIWDRTQEQLSARRGSQKLMLLNAGTIPDRGLFGVFLGADGPRIGELDEEMVYESRAGDRIILGASTWQIQEITRDRVIVIPAPGEPGRLPFWHGERPGRPVELGRAVGAFLRELDQQAEGDRRNWVQAQSPLDEWATDNLLAYLNEQRSATEVLPTDRTVVIESFRDELGDWRVCILTPFGARVHAPWAMAVESLLSARAGFPIQALWADDGVVLRIGDAEELPELEVLLPEPEEVHELLLEQLRHSALFAARFRENAGRALLIPRREPTRRTPLWAQRLRSQELLAVAGGFPDFPIVLETLRECIQDVFDLPALREVLQQIRSRQIRVHSVQTRSPSPMARNLVFAWVAAFMYDGDAPLAERRAQALTLDRTLLRELLGEEELRELLDAEAVAEVERELRVLGSERRITHADLLHDRLRTLGDLTEGEIAERSAADPEPWLRTLTEQGRAFAARVGGELRWIAGEDASAYRDALGVQLPPGLPLAFLEATERPMERLVLRYARTHGPFASQQLAQRFGLPHGVVHALLEALKDRDELICGAIRPGGQSDEWCHPWVLRRLKRRSLARLRNEVEPVEGDVLGRFLPSWHGLGGRRGGASRMAEVIDQLEGVSLPWSALETEVLPARIPDFDPSMLDQLGAMGQVVWLGRGSLGARDGRVALYRRERVPLLVDPPEWDPALDEGSLSALRRTLWDHLNERGASFLVALQQAAGEAKASDVTAALWDLAWAGLITNDTFQPLRALKGTKRKGSRASWTAGGRWSSVHELRAMAAEGPSDTARAHARAGGLLQRYGVVSREAAKADELPGGFSSVYGVYRAMEESGRARRGWFVAELTGAQFALPGAVDRLRSFREASGLVHTLASVDPANPYGRLLPWPQTTGGKPRRQTGAKVVLVDGAPVLYASKGVKRWLTFPAAADPDRLGKAVAAVLAWRTDRPLVIERLDGVPALESAFAKSFLAAGFVEGYRGLERSRF